MRVSSKHLTLASSVFKKMLQPGFKEGQQLLSTGFLELALPEDNPHMFIVLLNIIHGRTRKVMRILEWDDFLQITILIDKYQLQEVAEIYSTEWIQRVEDNDLLSYYNRLLHWIFIFWVYGKEDLFEERTLDAQREATEIITTDLPIPSAILGMNQVLLLRVLNSDGLLDSRCPQSC